MRRIDGEDLLYPWEIRYQTWQIRWLLSPQVWDFILKNQWPFHIKEDIVSQSGSHHAPFEDITLLRVEILDRLGEAGKDGQMVFSRYHHESSDNFISRMYNIPLDDVSRRIKRAMRYISGKRKPISYSQWIANGWSVTPRRSK